MLDIFNQGKRYLYIYNWTIDRKMVRKFINFFYREKVAYFSFFHIFMYTLLCTRQKAKQ